MSTARTTEMSRLRKYSVPAFCVLAAAGYAAVFLAHHDVPMAIAGVVIMLGYGTVVTVFSRRSEVAALLSDTAHDERHAQISRQAHPPSVPHPAPPVPGYIPWPPPGRPRPSRAVLPGACCRKCRRRAVELGRLSHRTEGPAAMTGRKDWPG